MQCFVLKESSKDALHRSLPYAEHGFPAQYVEASFSLTVFLSFAEIVQTARCRWGKEGNLLSYPSRHMVQDPGVLGSILSTTMVQNVILYRTITVLIHLILPWYRLAPDATPADAPGG